MTRFLLIRHAMTAASGNRLVGRRAGVHLNEQGRMQAQTLAERFAGGSADAVYSSPLERAVETAEPIAKLLGLEVITCEDFLEIEFGEWTSRAYDDIADEALFQRFNTFRSCAPVPAGEFMLQAQVRIVLGLEKLRVRHPHATVAVVSHGDLIKAAVAHYAGIPLDLFQRLEISLASASIVELDADTVRILAVNDTGGVAIPGAGA